MAAWGYGLLGPVEVRVDGRAVPLPGARQRLVLTMLLVDFNRMVPAGRLIDELWEAALPGDPRGALRTQVSRLRRALGPAGGDLATAEGGYCLTVQRGQLDATRFEDMLAEAARASGEQALGLVDEALALWRGPPVGEFADRPFALSTVARLNELRLVAAERRAELLLIAGLVEEAVATLQALLAEHPEREQARGLLMQALYRVGRHTEALSTFQSWRHYLAEELGLDPSPALRRIEQDILRHTAGAPDTRREVANPTPTLPVPVTSFVGRDEDLAAVTGLLGQARLVTLHGPGGVGKTRLALEVAARTGGSYRNGICFCDLAAVSEPHAVVRALATAAGLSERAFQRLDDQLVEQLAGRHLLLVLDNCEHVAQPAAILAERLLKETRNVTLLATSRERLEVDGEHVWQVRPLPVSGLGAPAVRLFLDRARAADPAAAPQDSDIEAVAALCARLDGLPLAIELAAARLPGTTVSELVGNLRDRFGLLTVGRRADSRHHSLRAVMDWSYEQLTPEQQDLFGQLAVFYGSFDAAAAHAIADGHDDPADVTRLLLYLVDRSLVTAELDGATTSYRLLETLRSYGLERLAEQGRLDAARARHARWAADLVARAERGLRGADEASWAASVERHFSDLRAAHSWLADTDPELGLQMAAQLHWYALWRCHSEVYRWADASTAGAAGSRSPFYPEALASAAFGALYRGDMQAAGVAARAAFDAARSLPPVSTRRPLEALAEVATFRGELAAAVDLFTRAYDLSIGNGDFRDAAWDAVGASAAYAYGGRLGAASRLADQARAAADRCRSPSALALVSWLSGEIAIGTSPGQARQHLQQAVALAESAGSRFVDGLSRVALATLDARHGDTTVALGHYERAIREWQQAGAWTPMWVTIRTLVELLTRAGACHDAAILYGAVTSASSGAPPFGADADRLRQSAALLRQHLTDTEFRVRVEKGEQLDGSQVIRFALEAIARAATKPDRALVGPAECYPARHFCLARQPACCVDPAVLDELRGERRDRGWHHGPFGNIRGVAGADQASSCTILAAGRAGRTGNDGARRYCPVMAHVTILDLNLASLRGAVDASTYARGAEYARQRDVLYAAWDPDGDALRGVVRGQENKVYNTAAFFSLTRGLHAEFELGECSCPVEFNCKHVVALVLSALVPDTPGPARQTGPQPAAWEKSLDSMLSPGGSVISGTTPLAIELVLAGGPGQPRWGKTAGYAPLRLIARLVRPGKNGGWVGGDLSWGRLDALRYSGDYREEQVRLLRELYVLYQARGARGGYYGYSYGDDRSIELSAVGSRQLWPLLDEAAAAGLRLVYPGKRGVLAGYGDAEFCLDVTRGAAGGLRIVPVIRAAGGEPAAPVAFIGAEGHGAVCVDPAEAAGGDPGSWRFRLARLIRPVPPTLQQMTLGGESLQVPAAEAPRFRDRYYPRLRHAAAVISSDGSFTPPAISGPDLVLRASYQGGHELEASWEWAYRVGDSPLRAPLEAEGRDDGYRDPAAERALLAGLDLPLDHYGLLGPGDGLPGTSPRALAPRTRLTGIDTMRFTTELLPLLADQPGLILEVSGEPADYREAGDSLQITVSADELAGETDWFDLGVTITVEGHPVPFLEVFLALSRDEPHLLLPDGAYFSLDKPELRALARLIEEARALQDSQAGQLRISRYQAGFWDELAALGVIGHQAAAWREQVQGLLSADIASPTAPPPGLRARLRPYQQDGFGWLAFLWEHRLGGILADDMGLGKTLQCLALISHARQCQSPGDPAAGPFLIVAPTSVVGNWAAEAARFAPDLRVVPISGTVARLGQGLGELAAGADAVVTSYALLRMDFAAYAEVGWSGLLLDEAQQAKNRQSKVYQCARRLPAPVKIAITGTPLENNLMELWSLLSITAPGLFPSPDRFRDYYARPVERQGDSQRLAQLQRRIRPLVRRRTKDQVAAELPAKQEQVLEVELHPQHRKVYQTRLQRERQKVLGLIGDMNANRFTIFRSLTLLRQLSLHAGLVDEAHASLASAKIDALLGQLQEVTDGGHRALVFSQFTGFLGKVRERLEAESIPYCYLDGGTRDRAAVVRRFKDGTDPVFLISLKAGGFGLNLTEADYCFLLDPWWNPATEMQAVDRTHRIGQTRSVMVYRLVAKDTIEEKVMALKARKARLFSSVLDDGNVFGTGLDAEDIRALLG